MTKLSALKICLIVKISNFPHISFNLNISAIITDTYLKFSVPVLTVSREGNVSQILYLGPSLNFLKC